MPTRYHTPPRGTSALSRRCLHLQSRLHKQTPCQYHTALAVLEFGSCLRTPASADAATARLLVCSSQCLELSLSRAPPWARNMTRALLGGGPLSIPTQSHPNLSPARPLVPLHPAQAKTRINRDPLHLSPFPPSCLSSSLPRLALAVPLAHSPYHTLPLPTFDATTTAAQSCCAPFLDHTTCPALPSCNDTTALARLHRN